jgi:hypothetical protein
LALYEYNTAEIRLIVCKASELVSSNFVEGVVQAAGMIESFVKQHIDVLFECYTKEDKQAAAFDWALRVLGFSSSVFSPFY